jgi:hypothetical protein
VLSAYRQIEGGAEHPPCDDDVGRTGSVRAGNEPRPPPITLGQPVQERDRGRDDVGVQVDRGFLPRMLS